SGGQGGGGDNAEFSIASGKPLLSCFFRWAIDHHLEHRQTVLTLDLDGHDLAEEDAKALGVGDGHTLQVLDATECAECFQDPLLNVRSDFVGHALLSARSLALAASWHV